MSDPKEFNYTESNEGIQVDIGTFFTSEFTFSDCVNGVDTPIDLTDLVLTGTVKQKDGTLIANLAEVLDTQSTGLYVVDAVNGIFRFQLDSTIPITIDDLGEYDIRYTDALGRATTFLRGKIQFLLTASS